MKHPPLSSFFLPFFLLSCFFFLLSSSLSAQEPEFKVTSFTHEENSMLARLNSNLRLDDNDEACALILVRTAETGLGFTSNTGTVGNADWKNGDYWVYVSQGARSIKIFKQGIKTVEYIFEIIPQSRETYLLELQVLRPEPKISILPVTIISSPENASLSIDGKKISRENPTTELSEGLHNIVLEMQGYERLEKNINVDRSNAYFNLSLNEISKAALMIESTPSGAEVYLDGIMLGETPFSVFYPPGNYSVKVVKKGYISIDNQSLTIISPQTFKNFTLEENIGHITINTHETANVYINGTEYFKTKNIKFSPQLLNIKVSMPKAETVEQQIVLKQNDNLNLDLFPKVLTGSLQVAVTPFDAIIELNGDAGEHYTASGMKIFDNIPIGIYTIKVSAPGHLSKEETVELKSDEKFEKSIKLIRNTEEIETKPDDIIKSDNTSESSSGLQNICDCLINEYSFASSRDKNNNDILVSFNNGNHISKTAFINIFNKNNTENISNKTVKEEYLEILIEFKMKVFEAEELGMMLEESFINELKGYCVQLSSENSNEEALLNEAYQRLKKDIRASHILIMVDTNAKPEDTLAAYKKIMNISEEILSGRKTFAEAAAEYSDDQSTRDREAVQGQSEFRPGNKGDLGYFTVFNMVYPFESAAYNTPVGEISMPIRSRFGYHLVKVNDKRDAMGVAEVAHIFVAVGPEATEEELARKTEKINNIYQKLQEGMTFEAAVAEYSEDKSSVPNEGKLSKFTSSRVVPQFVQVVDSLKVGEVAAPVRTIYGWHIIKLISRETPGEYEEEITKLKERLIKDSRYTNSVSSIFSDINAGNCKNTLSQIETKHPDFLSLLSEYYDGILLFNLTDKEVWSAAVNDEKAQQNLYNSKKANYQNKKFEDVKNEVLADLQNQLETEWIKELNLKYQPKINYTVLNSIK